MNKQDRTDRILIGVALVILLVTSALFYFDDWMWGGRKSRGETIGEITGRNGDVRLKFPDDLKWQKASQGQDLAYNDAIYAGAGSQAELKVGQSHMTVTENTLIVLRRDQDMNFLNLNYGTLFGKLAKNEKLMIDTGNGKAIEFNATDGAQIVLRHVAGKTQLDVTSGHAIVTVDGKKSRIDKSTRLVLADKAPAAVRRNHLHLIRPLHDQWIISEGPMEIPFAWSWENGRPADPSEHFVLEFSGHSDFKNIHARKDVMGQLTTSLRASRSLSLYYRIKSGEETSPIEQVNFLRMESPLIVKPLVQEHDQAPKGENAAVAVEFQRPQKATVWYQLSSDPNFKTILANENTADLIKTLSLPIGQYYLRARSDYGSGHLTKWTEPRTFWVDRQLEMLPLARRHAPTRIEIPNRNYPPSLYSSSDQRVESYLAQRGWMSRFLPIRRQDFDTLKLRVSGPEGTKDFDQATRAWPAENVAPGQYRYSYQATKQGYLPSEWSESRSLTIAMEPPKPVGDATYGNEDEQGQRSANWAFTPLLFARSYDVEVASTPQFINPIELTSTTPEVQTKLDEGEYYWRARARDAHGRLISSFSNPYKLKSMPEKVPVFLAKREPQSTERTTTRIERLRERPFEPSGWWAWLGTGENYVDYRQSIPGRGSLDSYHLKGPSQYFEGGYQNDTGYGGVISYKNTPGQLTVKDATIQPDSYRWTTMSLEGMMRKTSPFSIANSPVIYGLRIGIQQHRIPFIFLDADYNLLLKMNDMTTASFGVLAEWTKRRWTYYWLMRYQFPLSTKADGSSVFNIDPVFAFDGSLGSSYNITEQLKLGLFWYGQWHQMNFTYGDGNVTNTGFQSLFYSDVDVRLGFDF